MPDTICLTSVYVSLCTVYDDLFIDFYLIKFHIAAWCTFNIIRFLVHTCPRADIVLPIIINSALSSFTRANLHFILCLFVCSLASMIANSFQSIKQSAMMTSFFDLLTSFKCRSAGPTPNALFTNANAHHFLAINYSVRHSIIDFSIK